MIYGMYLSTAGAKAQSFRQDVIANNIANVNTVGFRRQFAVVGERPDHVREFGGPKPTNPADPRNLGGGVHMYQTPSDLRTQGNMEFTERGLDLAINGDGFFEVQRMGERYLTRAGDFTTDRQGFLRTSDGEGLVLADSGSPIRIDAGALVAVTPDGQVVQNNETIARLSLRTPVDPENIYRAGDNLYRAVGGTRDAQGKVEQFQREGANVDPILEMTDLIETARSFEFNIQMIQTQNDGLSTLIQTVPRLQ